MALSDPFSTTYQGSFQAGQSLGQGIQSAAGSYADYMQKKKEQEQVQHMMKMMGVIQQTGAVSQEEVPLTDEEYIKQAEKAISGLGDKLGTSDLQVTGSSDPAERRKQYDAILKPLGLDPKPKVQPTLDVNKMMPSSKMRTSMSFDASGKPSFNISSQEVDPMVDEMRKQTQEDRKTRLGQQQEKNDMDAGLKIDRMVNPLNATRGSQLGLLGQTAVRAKRAIDLLSDKNFQINPQMLSAIGTDMAGILQGGAPTIVGMSEQQYNTLQSTLAKATQYLYQHPQGALPDDIRNYLLDTFERLNKTGSDFIRNNTKTVEILQKEWIKRNPEDWEALKANIEESTGVNLSSSSKSSTDSVLGAAGLGGEPPMSREGGTMQQSSQDYQSYLKTIGQ